jgi:hypothetical protein
MLINIQSGGQTSLLNIHEAIWQVQESNIDQCSKWRLNIFVEYS